MAKAKRSAEDLDAELAALEAELAALEGKRKQPAHAASPPVSDAPAAPAAAPTKRKLPSFGRKKEDSPPTPVPEPRAAPSPDAPAPSYDASLWRQEGAAWVRTVPEAKPRVVRRVLDENGNVIREEPADKRDVEAIDGVKAERGAGKLLGRFRR